LRRLEALLVVADKEHGYVISGSGELIEPDDGIPGDRVGWQLRPRGGAGRSPRHRPVPKDIVQRSLEIASAICVYTNTHISILEL